MKVTSLVALALLGTLCSAGIAAAAEPYVVELDVVLSKNKGKKPKGGVVKIEIHPDWAPVGAARFKEIVELGIWDWGRFFRVVPDFIVQWGIPGDASVAKEWKNKRIPDDPVVETNARGSITFATSGANSRTSQVFINFKDNASLDKQGFAPFGRVIEGMDIVDQIYAGYGGDPDQGKIQEKGNQYLRKEFPKLSYIRQAKVASLLPSMTGEDTEGEGEDSEGGGEEKDE
eukprot:CAMPEP_0197597536 /NCGR_PEP_ID=MMETSP1326-20131121/27529_1 /TAXON_ID=1155430 /ORGANISM="Genus nov. species nov., Strain RCC2288" /LENGTH=229 /DNA_ID=CAMNT_0043164225 /DNA_START=35 /DNA_END=721 /DNA_ORIENTATION=+